MPTSPSKASLRLIVDPAAADSLAPFVPSNSEVLMPSPQSPGTTPSAYPKEHSTYHTGRASPATTWHGSRYLPADASDPAFASYYMSPTSNASYPPPPPVNPSPPSGVAVSYPPPVPVSPTGTAYGWLRPTSTAASLGEKGGVLASSVTGAGSKLERDMEMYRSTSRAELTRPHESGPKGMVVPDRHNAGYVMSGINTSLTSGRVFGEQPPQGMHHEYMSRSKQAAGGGPSWIAPTVKNGFSRNNAPVANSLGAWGRATSLTGSGLEGMSEAREIY